MANENYPARVALESMFDPKDNERFRMTLRFREFIVENDGSIRVWMDRRDVESLQSNCSVALQEDDYQVRRAAGQDFHTE